MKYFLMAFLLIGSLPLIAQQTVAVSGGNASGNGGTVSYTVGQINYKVYSDGTTSILEGCQQPYEIYVITALENIENTAIEIYPNPVSDFLRLFVSNQLNKNLRYEIYDTNGNLIRQHKISETETAIDMQNVSPGAYFINIYDDHNHVKIFKLIKNR